MGEIKDGGAAFPVLDNRNDGYTQRLEAVGYGLSKRDYFAGQALIGLVVNLSDQPLPISGIYESLSIKAYKIADAMLVQREKE